MACKGTLRHRLWECRVVRAACCLRPPDIVIRDGTSHLFAHSAVEVCRIRKLPDRPHESFTWHESDGDQPLFDDGGVYTVYEKTAGRAG